MEQYVRYLRKSRFDRDYAELSVEETLSRHEAILDKLASDRGYYIAKTYYEVVSGESIAARPEIQKMLEEVSAECYAGVLVVDLERLARGNGADQAYISQVFQYSGTKIITPMKTYDPCNEYDEEYFEFGLFMSRREYKTINRRLVRGRESSASEGKFIGSIAPYGYEKVKLPNEKGFVLQPHPQEAEVVQRIFSMFLGYQGTKMIANELNDCGIPTRHGELWSYSTISNILVNPVYMGKIRRGYCKQSKRLENGVVKKRIKHEKNFENYTLYDGRHPPLISEEVFLRAQEIRKEKRPTARVKETFTLQNAFAGLIYCGVCGQRIGRTTTTVSRGAVPRFRCVNCRNCHNASAEYTVVEDKIIAALRTWLDGYRVKVETVGFAGDIASHKEKIARLEQEADKLETQMENAFNLIEQGVYTLETFKKRREKLTAEQETIQEKRRVLTAELTVMEQGESGRNLLIPQAEELLSTYQEMTVQERNNLLKAILYKIEYHKGADGKIAIDLYPRLPHLKTPVGIMG